MCAQAFLFSNLKMCEILSIFSTALCAGQRVAAGDLVANGNIVGDVKACCAEAGTLCAIVDCMSRVRTLSSHSVEVSPRGGARAVWAAADISVCAAWSRTSPDKVVVILKW